MGSATLRNGWIEQGNGSRRWRPVLASQLGDFTVKLAERGIDTCATLAFTINIILEGDGAVFVNKLAILVLGSEDHVKEPALRRLFAEAYTLT